MTRADIETRVKELADQIGPLKGQAAAAGGDEAAVLRTKIAVLEEEKRTLEGRLQAAQGNAGDTTA